MIIPEHSPVAFITGLCAGFLISIPVGPINLTIINEGARRGFRWALLIGLGSVLMESIDCALALTGFFAATAQQGSKPVAPTPQTQPKDEKKKEDKRRDNRQDSVATQDPKTVEGEKVESIKIDTDLVELDVFVIDQSSAPVTNLSKENFSVFEDKIKQDIDLAFVREDVTSLLAESQDGLKRVTRIVRDLKDFSHVDESERQWADLEAGLESTLRVVANEIKYKAEVVKQFCGLPPLECFPFQLKQVFMNLLVNASHAIEERGTITLRTGQDEQLLWVEVQDTGKGIKPENLQRIFEPFFTTKPVGQGTGLGLSLSYGIVQKHGGRIEVQSELGQGTRFRVVLPKLAGGAVKLPG